MAAAEARLITFEETELLSFLHQNVIRKLCEEAQKQGLPKTDPWVVQAVVLYFNIGPAPHGVFHNLVHRLAHSFLGEFRGSQFMSPHTVVSWRLGTVTTSWRILKSPQGQYQVICGG